MTKEERNVKKIGVLFILGWIVGSIFVLTGIITLFEQVFVGGLYILTGLIIIPKFNELLKRYTNISLSTPLRIAIFFVLLVFIEMYNQPSFENQSAMTPVTQGNYGGSQDIESEEIKETSTPLKIGCDDYDEESISKIKYDFWDVETNKKIEKCLDTSQNIKFYDITDDPFIQTYPSIFGNYVVWEDYKKDKSDIYLYDIETKQEQKITTHAGEDFKPIIKNNIILFHKQYNEDPMNPTPKDRTDQDYWRSELYVYDIADNKFIQLSNHDVRTIDKGSFDGNYLVTSHKRLLDLVYYVGDKLKDDSTTLKIMGICNSESCDNFLNRGGIGCFHSDKLCNIDTTIFDGNKVGRYLQDGYLIGGSTIIEIDSGDYYNLGIPYKQVKGDYALEYKLRWRLEDLALINLNEKPLFYSTDIPNDVLSQFDTTIDGFSICLDMHYDSYKTPVCDKQRDFLRIYDFKKDKYYTIKGNLWGDGLIEEGDFIGDIRTKDGLFGDGIYDIHNRKEFDFHDNKIVWAFNNEKVINDISDKNTDIRLAVIN